VPASRADRCSGVGVCASSSISEALTRSTTIPASTATTRPIRAIEPQCRADAACHTSVEKSENTTSMRITGRAIDAM
jgi:hypothetical protein